MPSPFQTRQIARQIGGPTYSPTAIAATKALTAGDDGTTFNVTQAAYTITLPAISSISAGWNVTFNLSTAASHNTVVAAASGDEDKIYGIHIDASPTAVDAADNVTFASGTAVLNDRMYFECDGTRWFCQTISAANGGITSAG